MAGNDRSMKKVRRSASVSGQRQLTDQGPPTQAAGAKSHHNKRRQEGGEEIQEFFAGGGARAAAARAARAARAASGCDVRLSAAVEPVWSHVDHSVAS